MGVYLRGKYYWMRFHVAGKQKRKPCGTTNKRLAFEIFHKQKALIAENRYLDKKQPDQRMRFEAFAPIYMERHAKVYKRSWKTADWSYLHQILPFFGRISFWLWFAVSVEFRWKFYLSLRCIYADSSNC